MKAEVRERTDRPQQDNLNSFVTSKQKENHWRLDSTRFSKWYGTKPRNKLEIEISLVRVVFIDNCRNPVEQRATGELTQDELKSGGTDHQ